MSAESKGAVSTAPDPLEDLFHGCALRAWLEVAAETGQWPPDSEITRRRAYDLYEQELRRASSCLGSG